MSGNNVGWIITGTVGGVLALLFVVGLVAGDGEQEESTPSPSPRITIDQAETLAADAYRATSQPTWSFQDTETVGDTVIVFVVASDSVYNRVRDTRAPFASMCKTEVQRAIAPYTLDLLVKRQDNTQPLRIDCP